ncbi:vitamin K epoxide reductase family protein [Propionibacterium sp.]|uniref:vitamin K epoxide reductase family protein n=1 Tax=Propionibacterium sp. TaxID=1977903 RepID=UPI0039E7BEAA
MAESHSEVLDTDDEDLDPDLTRPAPQSWRARNAIEMIVSGVVGLFTSFVLSIEAWRLASNPGLQLACDVNSVISCTTVANTWQARVLGFPNAFLGILFESVVLAISVAILSGVHFPRWYMLGVQALYTIGLAFALWLFFESYFVIHALCPWCLLITLTTTLVWAGLTRMNVRDSVIPAPPGARWFVASGNDWIITIAFLFILAMLIFVRYGITLLR